MRTCQRCHGRFPADVVESRPGSGTCTGCERKIVRSLPGFISVDVTPARLAVVLHKIRDKKRRAIAA